MNSALRIDDRLDVPQSPLPRTHFRSRYAAVTYNNQPMAPEQPETIFDPKLSSGIQLKIVNGITLPDGVLALLEQLKSFEALSENWDSYGAMPHNPKVQAPVVNLIIVGHASKGRLPRLAPHPSGGVNAVWRLGTKELEVLVLPDQTCEICREDLSTGEIIGPDHTVSTDEANTLTSMFCFQN